MRNRFAVGMSCCLAWVMGTVFPAMGQTVTIDAVRLVETNRVEVDASSDADQVVTLQRSDVLATTGMPVAVEIVASNGTAVLTENAAGTGSLTFYTGLGRDLATSTFDTDGDGIKDATEAQAKGWLSPVDPSDATGVDSS